MLKVFGGDKNAINEVKFKGYAYVDGVLTRFTSKQRIKGIVYNGRPMWGEKESVIIIDTSDNNANYDISIYRYNSGYNRELIGNLDFDTNTSAFYPRYGDEIEISIICRGDSYVDYLLVKDESLQTVQLFTKYSDAEYRTGKFTLTGALIITVHCTYPQWRSIWTGDKQIEITGIATDFTGYIDGGFNTGIYSHTSSHNISSSWQYRITHYGVSNDQSTAATGSSQVVSQQDVLDATNGVSYQVTGITNVYRFRKKTESGGQVVNAIFYNGATSLGVRIHSDNVRSGACHITKVEAYY